MLTTGYLPIAVQWAASRYTDCEVTDTANGLLSVLLALFQLWSLRNPSPLTDSLTPSRYGASVDLLVDGLVCTVLRYFWVAALLDAADQLRHDTLALGPLRMALGSLCGMMAGWFIGNKEQ